MAIPAFRDITATVTFLSLKAGKLLFTSALADRMPNVVHIHWNDLP